MQDCYYLNRFCLDESETNIWRSNSRKMTSRNWIEIKILYLQRVWVKKKHEDIGQRERQKERESLGWCECECVNKWVWEREIEAYKCWNEERVREWKRERERECERERESVCKCANVCVRVCECISEFVYQRERALQKQISALISRNVIEVSIDQGKKT